MDRERVLSESFIRELNQTILVRDFYKTSRDGEYRYKIHAGIYKTRPNSVITPTGEIFNYASMEETLALMSDLVRWYNEEEQKGVLSPVELAALFHYRYIRIHPFEDGNGRIARLLMNYILLRHDYPMIVIRTEDQLPTESARKRWSEVLNLIQENPPISRKELAEKLSINPSAVQKHIQKLKTEGFIKRFDGDRGGHWEIIKE